MITRILFAYVGAIVAPVLILLLGAIVVRVLLLFPGLLPPIDGHPPFEIIVLSGALIGLVVCVFYSDIKEQYLRGAILARSVSALIIAVFFLGGAYKIIVWDGLISLLMAICAPLLAAVVSGLILRKHIRFPEQ